MNGKVLKIFPASSPPRTPRDGGKEHDPTSAPADVRSSSIPRTPSIRRSVDPSASLPARRRRPHRHHVRSRARAQVRREPVTGSRRSARSTRSPPEPAERTLGTGEQQAAWSSRQVSRFGRPPRIKERRRREPRTRFPMRRAHSGAGTPEVDPLELGQRHPAIQLLILGICW